MAEKQQGNKPARQKIDWKRELKWGISILAGLAIMTISFNFFFVPNSIAPGGITGLATIAYVLWGFPIGLVSAILNVPLFLLSWKRMGHAFALRSLLSMLVLSLMLDTVPIIKLTSDMLLASAMGGVLLGVGLAFVLMGNATTGGTDLLTAMVQKVFPNVSYGFLLLGIECSIVLVSAFTLGTEVTLYAVVALVVSSRLIDMLQAGVAEGRLFFVITKHPDEISTAIMDELERGVTLLQGKGAYSKQEKPVVFCVVFRNQVVPFKRLVHRIDPDAFVVLANVSETMGEGFNHILPPPGSGISNSR